MQIKKSKLCSICAITVLLLFFVAYNYQSTALSLAGFGVMLGMLLIFPVFDIFTAFAFLLPGTYLIKIVGTGAALIGYWLILAVLVHMIRTPHFRINKRVLMFLILHLLCVFASIVTTGNLSMISSLIRFLAFLMLLQILEQSPEVHYAAVTKAFVNGCISVAGLSFLYNSLHGINTFGGYFTSIGNDRNYFAVTMAFAISALLVWMYRERLFTAANYGKLFILFLAGILSASRTFVVLIVLIAAASIFMSKKMNATAKMGAVFLLLVFAFVSTVFFENSFALVLDRFHNSSIRGGNGRLAAWAAYLTKAFSSVITALFGVGDSMEYRIELFLTAVEHNTLVQSIFTIGILGTISLLVLLYEMYQAYSFSRQYAKKKIIQYLPLICILVGYCTINGLYSSNFMFSMLLSFLLLCPEKSRRHAAVCDGAEGGTE